MTTSHDELYMAQALALAQRGVGWASPNPAVGCVLVRDGEVIGRGWHARLGALHAETAALADAGDARGTTCYVTLEPCSHVGRQPPCCPALVEAGVARVVYGIEDADPRSAGRARSELEARGIEVRSGVLEAECKQFLDAYLFAQWHSRPQVRLKLALSLDGKLACAGGASQWLSGPQSLGLAHYLRQSHDAVLVGVGTVQHDDPRLTVRPEVLTEYMPLEGLMLRDPVRVILDPGFALLPRLKELRLSQPGNQRDDLPKLVLAGVAGRLPSSAAEYLADLPIAVEVVELPASEKSRVPMAELWARLWQLGCRSVLIEGGAGVARNVLLQGAADRLTAVLTPTLLGSDALEFSPELGAQAVSDGISLSNLDCRMLGPDVVVTGELGPGG